MTAKRLCLLVSTPLIHLLVFSVCYDSEIEGETAANQRDKALQSIGGKKRVARAEGRTSRETGEGGRRGGLSF